MLCTECTMTNKTEPLPMICLEEMASKQEKCAILLWQSDWINYDSFASNRNGVWLKRKRIYWKDFTAHRPIIKARTKEAIYYRHHPSLDTITSTTPEWQMLLPPAQEWVLHVPVPSHHSLHTQSLWLKRMTILDDTFIPKLPQRGTRKQYVFLSFCSRQWALTSNKARLMGNSPNMKTLRCWASREKANVQHGITGAHGTDDQPGSAFQDQWELLRGEMPKLNTERLKG